LNTQHLKYAVEVAKAGSINKAAENLYMNQPNLSRAIRELESSLGIAIFDRSTKGMVVTPEGEVFLGYAQSLLRQIDEIEDIYKKGSPVKQKFSVSVPRASYISEAFACFTRSLNANPAEIFYKEANALQTIQSVLQSDYKLGILRYPAQYDKYFREMLEENRLTRDLIAEYSHVLLMNREHPLASREIIRTEDLKPYIEIAHADPYVPSLSASEVKKEALPAEISRRIFVYERGSQFDILSANPDAFMWVSPVPERLLSAYGLIEKDCADTQKEYKDVLIYQKDYKLTPLDKQFITELCQARRRYLK